MISKQTRGEKKKYIKQTTSCKEQRTITSQVKYDALQKCCSSAFRIEKKKFLIQLFLWKIRLCDCSKIIIIKQIVINKTQ